MVVWEGWNFAVEAGAEDVDQSIGRDGRRLFLRLGMLRPRRVVFGSDSTETWDESLLSRSWAGWVLKRFRY